MTPQELSAARPSGWQGRPFRWTDDFAFMLDDGVPVHLMDCYRPNAGRGGYTSDFGTFVLVHPALGWLLLEVLTFTRHPTGGTETGEYKIRRATQEECLPLFHDDDPCSDLHLIEQANAAMRKYFDRSGRRIEG